MTLQAIEPSAPVRRDPVRKYDAQEVALAVGLSLSRFRKVRVGWTRDRDFPAELNEPGEPIRYAADAVDRWVERRTRRVQALAAPSAHTPPPAADRKAGREGRSALRALKGDA